MGSFYNYALIFTHCLLLLLFSLLDKQYKFILMQESIISNANIANFLIVSIMIGVVVHIDILKVINYCY
jgi:hypothetical protein